MLRNLISEKYFAGLDLGSQTIKTSILRTNESHQPEVVGVFESKTSGFGKASIIDLGEFSESINAAVAGLSKNTGIKLKEVTVGVGAELITDRFSQAVIPLCDRDTKVVTDQDIRKVQTQARLLGVNMEEVIVHDFPQHYRLDDAHTAVNPAGLYGRKLEVQSLLILAHNTLIKNLTKAVNQAGLEVGSILYSGTAASDVCLTPEQKRQGCLFIDIGCRRTSVMIFKDGQLRWIEHLPAGGGFVTRSIAESLNLTYDLAEDIKQSYAVATRAAAQNEEEILVKREDGYIPVKKELISASIEPVIAEFLSSLAGSVKKSALHDQLNAGVILAGGGALLPGLIERVGETTNLPVKMAKVGLLQDKVHHAAKFAATIGLSLAGFQKAHAAVASREKNGLWTAQFAHRVK
ncbi:MAG: cell division protein FtsA, partial [Candidatus Omnitrophota bacterium]|nr:cell division protein FtsA [Candidatus Omnitrophota bacterium]